MNTVLIEKFLAAGGTVKVLETRKAKNWKIKWNHPATVANKGAKYYNLLNFLPA